MAIACYDLHMKATQCRYTIGQRVEVFTYNFEVPGFPQQWFPGEVTRVELGNADRGLWDVMVTTDDGKRHPQIVGPRGGNKHIRAATS